MPLVMKKQNLDLRRRLILDITYRKLTEKEIETFIQIRINQLREEGAKEDFDLRPALKDYYNRHMSDGSFVSWLAIENDRIRAKLWSVALFLFLRLLFYDTCNQKIEK
jgi:hypothetical protein